MATGCGGTCGDSPCNGTNHGRDQHSGTVWRADVEGISASSSIESSSRLCQKCVSAQAEVVIDKFRSTVKQQHLIVENDRVLAAVSGGTDSLLKAWVKLNHLNVGSSSWGLLQLLKQIQNLNKNRMARGKVTFELGAVLIDESCFASGRQPSELAEYHEAAWAAMRSAGLPAAKIHVIRMEGLLAGAGTEASQAADQLRQVMQRVQDSTGRDDLWDALRTSLLLRLGRQWGYTKVVRGENANTLAVRALSGVCKGVGYGLPASLQSIDARHADKAPVIILPLRDIPARDLEVFSSMHGWGACPPQPQLFWRVEGNQGTSSLNAIVGKFVAQMQLRLPSTASTILRVVDRLQAFPFNEIRTEERSEAETLLLCRICSAPMQEGEERGSGAEGLTQTADLCVSCSNFIIFPAGDPSDPQNQSNAASDMKQLLKGFSFDGGG